MLGIRYFKATPSSYIVRYRNGAAVREGAGPSFFYFEPNTSIVAIPLESIDVPFVFNEVSADFQQVTVQGQVTYRVANPRALAQLMNFTLNPAGAGYLSDDPQKLSPRVVNAVQVQVRSLLQQQPLKTLLQQSDELVGVVRERLRVAESFTAMGLELVDLAILAIRPTPETSRALEARVRESILKDADDAIYARRHSAIAQERSIKENELNTEIAVETKKREIRETQLDAERAVLAKRIEIQQQEIAGKVELEKRNETLTALRATNAKVESDSKGYALNALMQVVQKADPRVIQALSLDGEPGALIAAAFQNLAERAEKIGELNISPELLQALTKKATPASRG